MSVAESPVSARRLALSGVTWRGALVGAALPFLFLHVRYQPGVEVRVRSTDVGIEASDVAVLVLGAAAVLAGVREGFARLRPAWPAWLAAGALLAWIALRTLAPFHLAHAVTAAKFAEYALLALALPLLLRRRADVVAALAALVAWGAAAAVVGALQFFGADVAAAWPAGRRQPSFLGHSDLAALSGAVLAVGAGSLLLEGLLGAGAGAAALAFGAVGLVLAGASAGAAGAAAAVAAVAAVAWRRGTLGRARGAAVAAVLVLAVLGVAALRSGDYAQFLSFAGVKGDERAAPAGVQTYAQHTLLAYVGWEIFKDHPLAGAGWQRANDPDVFGPVLPAAHRRFPDVAPVSFPSPGRRYGVQNAYVNVLADLGAVGLLLWLAFLVAPLAVGAHAALRAPGPAAALGALGVAWLLLAAALWVPQSLVAGIPLDALTWLGVGAAAAGAAR